MKVKILVSILVAVVAASFFGWRALRDNAATGKGEPPAVEKRDPEKTEVRGEEDESRKKKVKVPRKDRKKQEKRRLGAAGKNRDGAARRKVRSLVKIVDEEANFTEEERKISDELQNSIDNENVKDAITLAIAASSSDKAELRRRAVEALGWFGKKAMAEMTLFMNDADEDVASEALNQWEQAMFEVSAGEEKAVLIELGMKTVKDPDALESMIMEVGELSNALAMQTMLGVIETGSPEAQKVVKDHYEFFTGEEYTNRQAAEQWLAENPDDE